MSHHDHHLLLEAIELKNKGMLEEATSMLLQLIQSNTDTDRAYYHLGLIDMERKELPRAIEHYQKAIAANPAYYKAYNNLGLVYMQQDRYQEAMIQVLKAHELAPQDDEPVLNLGLIYYKKQDFEAAIQQYEKVNLANMPPSLLEETFLSMGDCYLQLHRFDKAEEKYHQIIKDLNSNHYIALNQLAFIWLEIRHNAKEANKWIDRSLSVNARFRPALQNKGLILKALGQYEDAVLYLEKAASIEPDNFEPWYNLACVYAAMEKEMDVKQYLKIAMEKAPFIKSHVRHDPDFEPYRSSDWFIKLVQ